MSAPVPPVWSKAAKNSEEYKNYMAAKIFMWLTRAKITRLYRRVYPLCEALFRDHVHQKGKRAFEDGDEAFEVLSVAPEHKKQQYDFQCVFGLWEEEELSVKMFRTLFRVWMTRNVETAPKTHVKLLLYRLPKRDQSILYSPSDSEGDSESEYEKIGEIEVKVRSRKTKLERRAARKDVDGANTLLEYVKRKKNWKKGCRPDPAWTQPHINYTLYEKAKKAWEAERAAHHGLTAKFQNFGAEEADGSTLMNGVKRSLQMKHSKLGFRGKHETEFLKIMKERDGHDKRDLRDAGLEDVHEAFHCGKCLEEQGWRPDYVYHVASLSGEQAAQGLNPKRRIVIDESLVDLLCDGVCSYARVYKLAKGIADDMEWRTTEEFDPDLYNPKKRKHSGDSGANGNGNGNNNNSGSLLDEEEDDKHKSLFELPEEKEKLPCKTLCLVLPDKYCVYLSTLFTMDSRETPQLNPGDVACYQTFEPLRNYSAGTLWGKILYGSCFDGEQSMFGTKSSRRTSLLSSMGISSDYRGSNRPSSAQSRNSNSTTNSDHFHTHHGQHHKQPARNPRELIFPEKVFFSRKQKLIEFARSWIDTPHLPKESYCEDYLWYGTRSLWDQNIGAGMVWDEPPKYTLNMVQEECEKQASLLATFEKDPLRQWRFWTFRKQDFRLGEKYVGEANEFLDQRAAYFEERNQKAEGGGKKKAGKKDKKESPGKKAKAGKAKGGGAKPDAQEGPDPNDYLDFITG
ncbi:unnamed protein product [Amoebophrya sp. A120]|nr:unnamed protein product [Amoebophrya sp. A120]|eukprot:GSA120T00007846001.1